MADKKENDMSQITAAFLRCLDSAGNSGNITPANLLANCAIYKSPLGNIPGKTNETIDPNELPYSSYGWFNNTNSSSGANAPSGKAGLYIHFKEDVLKSVTLYFITTSNPLQLWIKIGEDPCTRMI